MKARTPAPSRALKQLLLVTPLAASLFFMAPKSHGDVIYAQNFGYAGSTPGNGTYVALSTVGWKGLYASTLGGNTVSAFNSYYLGIRNYTGRPTNLSNVNAPTSESNQYGAVQFFRSDNQAVQALVYTDQYVVNNAAYQVDSISWYAAGTSGGSQLESLRASLQIGGVWYVSDQMYAPALAGNSPANFGTSAGLVSVSISLANWFEMTAVTGSPFTISSTATALPTGDITAFGLFGTPRQTNGSYLMFDSLTINASAVPEPGAVPMLALGAGVVWLVVRRRNQVAR